MTETASGSPRGLDLGHLKTWLDAHVPERSGARLTARHLTGGRSNFTYEVLVDGAPLVLRRPPLGEAIATAHDMGREFRVMSALASTGVPVPQTYVYCEDSSVLGAPFYLMERVDGTSFFHKTDLDELGPERVRVISTRLVDTLVHLHAVDVREVGLSDFGRPEGFLGRQVRRWRRQFESTHTRDLQGLESLHSALEERVPVDGPWGIVHGDFKIDNVLVQDDSPVAVVDWEMSTLGDGLTDLALMLVYKRFGGVAGTSSVTDAASAPGYLTEDEILARYSDGTGRALDGFGFYLALAAFKLAGILQGVHYRHLNGQTEGSGFDDLGELPELLIADGLNWIKEYS